MYIIYTFLVHRRCGQSTARTFFIFQVFTRHIYSIFFHTRNRIRGTVDIKNALHNHATELKTLRGTIKSHWSPLTLQRKILLLNIERRPSRGYIDCETVAEALRDYIQEATGKKIRLTRETRTVLMHLYSLRHQYKKNVPVALSTVFAGYKHKDAVMRLRIALEESGLIKLEDGSWAYNPGEKKRNKAPKYSFSEEFVKLLEIMVASVKKGRESGEYEVNAESIRGVVDCEIEIGEEAVSNIRPNGEGSRKFPIILDKARHSENDSPELLEYQRVKAMSVRERKLRNKKLRTLWGGMSVSHMKRSGVYERCRLQCVSLGIGAEVDDSAFISAMGERYREDMYAKITHECDSRLPAFAKDPETGIRLCTRTVWSFLPKRDSHGNIAKAGCRPCNGLCVTRNDDPEESEVELKPGEASRHRIMKALHLRHHFDVHCSIHNLGKALITGKFENADLYTALARRMGTTRNSAKLAIMHGTFASLAEYCARHPDSKNAAKHIHHVIPATKQSPKKDVQFPFTYRELQDAMKAEGLPIHGRYTEIFWDEAFIYDLVRLYLLRDHNVRSIRIYDSFYTSAPISEELFIELINRAIGDYLKILAHADASLSFRL